MKQQVKSFLIPLLTVWVVSAFPAIFLYCQNTDEADFSEIVPALLVLIGVGTILLLLFSALLHSPSKGALSAALFMLILTNFSFIEQALKVILPKLKYWHTAPLVIVFGLHIIWAIHRFLSREMAIDITNVIGLVFSGLVAINIVLCAPQIINRAKVQTQLRESKTLQSEQQTNESSDMPNIYLFIFDEYANFPQMEEYYNYNNAPLKDFLIENNFAVSYTSQSESIYSTVIQTNLVNLDYVVSDITSRSEKLELRKNAVLFDLMRENGYKVQIYEDTFNFNGTLPVSGEKNSSGSATISGESISSILINHTILYPFSKSTVQGDLANILEIVDFMSNSENLPDNKTFTLVYLKFPHQPFMVDENGNFIDPAQSVNWTDKQYYLGQYKYATKLMLQMVKNIIENDPDCILILQSDHGARANGGSSFLEMFPVSVMKNILNAVYYRNENVLNIEGLTGINTLRTVLNKLWNLDYDLIRFEDYNMMGWDW